jgi:lipopolysaccharide/colanic/teichoic acid biosynthesis glycosyltransferase
MDGAAPLKHDDSAYRLFGAPAKLAHTLPYAPMRPVCMAYKRIQDIVLTSAIMAVVLLPMLLIALLIKWDSPGPVLFRQQRRGLHGKLFCCLKFRTMQQKFSDPHARLQSVRNDPRNTRIGRLLRATSLDELPQIFNVWSGDMSLIGPRPHAPGTNVDGRLLPDITTDYMLRYRVKPGITGWAQVNGCRGILDSDAKLMQRLQHDFYYISHWSPLLDLRILLKTVICLFNGRAF